MISNKKLKKQVGIPGASHLYAHAHISARTTHAASWAKKGSTYVNTFTRGADMKARETGQTQVPSSCLHQDPRPIYALFTLSLFRGVEPGHKAPAEGDTGTATFLPTAREIPANSTQATVLQLRCVFGGSARENFLFEEAKPGEKDRRGEKDKQEKRGAEKK